MEERASQPSIIPMRVFIFRTGALSIYAMCYECVNHTICSRFASRGMRMCVLMASQQHHNDDDDDDTNAMRQDEHDDIVEITQFMSRRRHRHNGFVSGKEPKYSPIHRACVHYKIVIHCAHLSIRIAAQHQNTTISLVNCFVALIVLGGNLPKFHYAYVLAKSFRIHRSSVCFTPAYNLTGWFTRMT